jgi:hypothetical protein
MRRQNVRVTPIAAALQVSVFVAMLFAVAALLAHSFFYRGGGAAELAGDTMQIIQVP